MRDERFVSVVEEALTPLLEDVPGLPEWSEITDPPVARSEGMSGLRGWAVAAVAVSVVLAVAGAMVLGLGSSDVEREASVPTLTDDPNDTVTTSEVATSEVVGLSVSAATVRPAPVTEERRPLGSGSFVTQVDDDLRARIASAATEAAAIWRLSEPIRVVVAVQRAGSHYAFVSGAENRRGLIAVDGEGNLGLLRYVAPASDVAIWYTRLVDSFPFLQLVWLDLPDSVAWATISTPERPDGVGPQRVVGDAVFIGMAKPSWNQTATLTAFDASGAIVETREVDVDGGGCSASREIPFPPENPDLPTAVQETRASLTLASVLCDFSGLSDSADASGDLFGVGADDVAAFLREEDRERPVMEWIRATLRDGEPTRSADGSQFTWSGDMLEITIGWDGVWLGARIVE